jgi:hypothetical protein
MMTLDIRSPIGWLFSLIGALLIGCGVWYGPPPRGTAAGWNINAGWGAVLLAFGIGMLLLARRHAARLRRKSD